MTVTTGAGTCVAYDHALVGLRPALATVGSVSGGHVSDAAGVLTVPGVSEAPGVLPRLVCPLPGALPLVAACVPLTSVPAVARCWPLLPPCSAVPASMMASRTGWMPNMTVAMTATAARIAASRSDPAPRRGKILRHGCGHRTSVRRGSHAGRTQCPCQVQFLIRSTTPRMTLTSQGRGGRPPIRARIFSSPSLPGSTPSASSDSARRSASSKPSSSGEVMPSPHLPATSVITFPGPRPP